MLDKIIEICYKQWVEQIPQKFRETILFLRREQYREGPEIIQSGDFRVLGDVIELWPVNLEKPHRLHYFDEDLEKVEILAEKWQSCDIIQIQSNRVCTEHGNINPGEFIVHPVHGVGIFRGIRTRKSIDDLSIVYIKLEYAAGDTIDYPFAKSQELMPYIGSRHPRLTRLYSKSWMKTKERVQKDLIKVARELLKIYAKRHLTRRPVFQKQVEWISKLAKSVDFSLTEDQERSLKEIEVDILESEFPMDRLLCGDVGFGKTEVAIRAAGHIIGSGKQVALIAPTTVLAEQHFALIKRRFIDLPVRVAHLSRVNKKEEPQVLDGLKSGEIDIVIGTHRLLGTDIIYKDLGMLVIDEEQKFGVAHKEKLKELRPKIDVLSLSATPIPRTLSMSLSGLKGLSLLRTAPKGRKPIETWVGAYSRSVVEKAIVHELKRGGQIYIVHNRVQSLGLVQNKIADFIKKSGFDVRVEMAHGQMDEMKLAKTMSEFLAGDISVLVASSIVEHGLDCPSANTLIVLHSEWFGLSDLYQLRGRVGRRNKQAFAYFMTGGFERDDHQLSDYKVTENTQKRLKALMEADELGSGWSIAMRDLEIRGGGNILGHQQHGNMEAIGLLLYAQLLKEAVGREAMRQGIKIEQLQGLVKEYPSN